MQKNYKYEDILIEPVMLHVIINVAPNFPINHTHEGTKGGGVKEAVPLLFFKPAFLKKSQIEKCTLNELAPLWG